MSILLIPYKLGYFSLGRLAMDKFDLIFIEEIPKYVQITNKIKVLMDENIITDGEKLPPIRELAKYLGVNKDTVINAYKKLEQEGNAVQIMGSGTYAKKKEMLRSFKKDYADTFKRLTSGKINHWIDFTGETTSSNFFPVGNLKNVLNEVLDRDGPEALIYQDVMGYENLRSSINERFWGGNQSLENILIVSGAQQGIDIISKAIINVNDNVIIEKPTYMGALTVFKWRKANIIEVPMEDNGADLEYLEKILKKRRIKCFYMMSYFQNPTGVSYSMEKKKRLLELASIYDFYIIEDDYLSELIYEEDIEYCPLKKLDNEGRVIYIKSFSKIFLPGIRMGYIMTPENLRESLQISKSNTDIATSSLMQRALDVYINKGYWIEHIEYLNKEYNKRYLVMKNLLQTKLEDLVTYIDPKGGLSFYLKIRENININSKELFYKLREKNTFITPGVMFFKNQKEGEGYFRIGFSQTDCENIQEGLNNIYEVLKGR